MYVESKTLASWLMCLRTFETCVLKHNSARFISAPWLAWQAAFKKTEIKLDILTDIMIERTIRCGICYINHRSVTANNKYMKSFDKKRTSIYFTYNFLMDRHWIGFKWVEVTSQFSKEFIENYNEETFPTVSPFGLKEWKLKKM